MNHKAPCDPLHKHQLSTDERLDLLLERMDELALRQANMAEIIIAWNNTKGFVRTFQAISKVIRWISMTAAATAVLWYAITHMEWPK
jgi:hypothetical protein